MVNVAIKEDELRRFVEQIVREALKRDGTRRANPAPQLATEPTGRDAEESHEIWCDGFMRVTEVAKFMALSRTKVYLMMDNGKLPYVRIDGGRRIPRKAVMDFAAEHLVEL